ncbi:histidinol-phosphate transaminase [candidate division FCPU426 bacterium]|nr:histidinol-phosphate transaminase [candidate division FCPU426 bacterium]
MNERLEKLREWIRPEVRGLAPYQPEPSGPRIRLDANESPYDMPAALKENMWKTFCRQAWNRYPDPGCVELRQALAAYEGVQPDQVAVGNGSDEIIRDLLICFGGAGTRTVFPTPTFCMYRLLTIALGGTPVGVRLLSDWSLDVPVILREIQSENSRILFIASPNNPTGNSFAAGHIEAILRGTDRLVVVDEAYRLFAEHSWVQRLSEFPNLAVLCTYSKAMSAAGIRIGYLLAHPLVVETVNRVRLPYNLDLFAQQLALAALRQPEFWQAQARLVKKERERLGRELSALEGVTVYPSESNFILLRVAGAERIKTILFQNSIAVRAFSTAEGLSDCLRVTVGTPEENTELIKQFASAILTQAR